MTDVISMKKSKIKLLTTITPPECGRDDEHSEDAIWFFTLFADCRFSGDILAIACSLPEIDQ